MDWSALLAINWGQWIPIGVSLLVAITGLYLAFDNRRLRQAEAERDESTASGLITKAALALVRPMQDKISELERTVLDQGSRLTAQSIRMATLEQGISTRDLELEGLRAGMTVLTNQMRRLGIVPEYQPPAAKPIETPKGQK